MITISQLKLPVSHTPDQLKKKILRMLGIQEKDLIQYTIRKRSLDARRKPELFYVYTVHCTVVNEDRVCRKERPEKRRRGPTALRMRGRTISPPARSL